MKEGSEEGSEERKERKERRGRRGGKRGGKGKRAGEEGRWATVGAADLVGKFRLGLLPHPVTRPARPTHLGGVTHLPRTLTRSGPGGSQDRDWSGEDG